MTVQPINSGFRGGARPAPSRAAAGRTRTSSSYKLQATSYNPVPVQNVTRAEAEAHVNWAQPGPSLSGAPAKAGRTNWTLTAWVRFGTAPDGAFQAFSVPCFHSKLKLKWQPMVSVHIDPAGRGCSQGGEERKQHLDAAPVPRT